MSGAAIVFLDIGQGEDPVSPFCTESLLMPWQHPGRAVASQGLIVDVELGRQDGSRDLRTVIEQPQEPFRNDVDGCAHLPLPIGGLGGGGRMKRLGVIKIGL